MSESEHGGGIETMAPSESHDKVTCCFCGEADEPVLWVGEVSHQLCEGCAAELNYLVCIRFRHGVELRPGLTAAQSAFAAVAAETGWGCEVPEEWTCCAVPPMVLAYVGGFHSRDAEGRVFFTRDGKTTADPLRARLFPFTRREREAAFGAALRWTEVLCQGRNVVPFMVRVLVVGNPRHPDEVLPAWELEGDPPPDPNSPLDRSPR